MTRPASTRTKPSRHDDDGVRAPGSDLEAVDQHVAGDRQVRSLAHRIEIGEGGVPAHAVDDVDRTRRHADVLVEVVQVGDARDSGPRRGAQGGELERRDLGVAPDF